MEKGKRQRMKMNDCYLPAEWYEQSMIQLTWPHEGTDWAYMLPEVEECFCRLAHEISSRQHLLIVTPNPKAVQEKLEKQDVSLENISWACVKTNDTWARDHSFITLLDAQGTPHLLDFCFNGWGMKFPANLDNQINRALRDTDLLHGEYHNRKSFVLEGGSIESDGQGTLLTTAECFFSPNRNDSMNPQEIETYLKDTLGASRVLWLHHGYLAGDDTDSHIDTLARLCPDDTIVYVQCLDKNDEHYEELKLMEKAGEIVGLVRQVKIELIPKTKLYRACYYIPDFTYFDKRLGKTVYEDTKGMKTKEYLLKRKLLYWRHGIEIKET
jgi:agmatine/peptidylarginine deiminase